jgi:hypothetical protein
MAGAEIVVDIDDENSNRQGYSCRDLEGHIWNFGTYDPRQGRFLKGSETRRYQVMQRPRVGHLAIFCSLLVNAMTSIALVALAYLANDHALSAAHASASSKRAAMALQVRGIEPVARTINDADDEKSIRAERNAEDPREQLAHERRAREALERAAKEAQDQLAFELRNSTGLEATIAELRKTIVTYEVTISNTPPSAPQEKGEPVAQIRIERMRNKYINLEGYKTHSGKSYAQCEQLCLAQRKCVALEFNRQDRTCELLDQLELPLADADADVGIKQGLGR